MSLVPIYDKRVCIATCWRCRGVSVNQPSSPKLSIQYFFGQFIYYKENVRLIKKFFLNFGAVNVCKMRNYFRGSFVII